MDNALIVSHSDKGTDYFREILNQIQLTNITFVKNAGEARRLLIENDYDLCIINTPFQDEFGENLAKSIAEKTESEVLLIVKGELYDEISNRVENYGIMTLSKPINKMLFWNSLKILQASSSRMKKVQVENQKLVQKIEDIRVINRAKCLLISRLSMTEPQAHRYIEKQAMDMRISRREVAEEILKSGES